MKIIFWGKYIDTYLADTFLRLQELTGQTVHYVLVEESFTRRQVTGQPLIDRVANPLTILPDRGFMKRSMEILNENADAIHIFLGFWGDKRLFRVLLRALRCRRRVAVIFEPYSTVPHGYWRDEGWLLSHLKVAGRYVAYRLLWPVLKFTKKDNLPCILAVSSIASEQLRQVGFSDEVIYPFGYFVERKEVNATQKGAPGVLRVVFSGSLILRKGLDIAIAAVQQINAEQVRVLLDIYGPGEIGRYLQHEIPGISYKGRYPQAEAQGIISRYDLLLVPSRHEGWGIVVNEALMQGVPVVISDRVGAKTLVECSGAGLIFHNEDIEQLSHLLIDLVERPAELARMKSGCTVIRDRITPQAGADYLAKVLKHFFDRAGERPVPPWEDCC